MHRGYKAKVHKILCELITRYLVYASCEEEARIPTFIAHEADSCEFEEKKVDTYSAVTAYPIKVAVPHVGSILCLTRQLLEMRGSKAKSYITHANIRKAFYDFAALVSFQHALIGRFKVFLCCRKLADIRKEPTLKDNDFVNNSVS